MHKNLDVEIQFTGDGTFLSVDGTRIAKRGRPDTPQAMTWVSLEAGWAAYDGQQGLEAIIIEYNGVRI